MCDPWRHVPRNTHMLTASHAPSTPILTRLPPRPAPVQHASCRAEGCGGKVNTTDRLQWVSEVEAIRDRQDQSAFAALFQHFAPRVKAYLIKTGSAPDVAEEVTQ